MARSLSNTKVLSALVQNGFSKALTRRGYAAGTQSARRGGIAKGVEEKGKVGISTDKVSWVPDPVTGYYKPENIKEIDVAELRATLLRKKLNN